jgi:hypothetical protein
MLVPSTPPVSSEYPHGGLLNGPILVPADDIENVSNNNATASPENLPEAIAHLSAGVRDRTNY